MVIDENDINKAWVIPAQSDDLRIPYQNKLAVYVTTDAGKNWSALRTGLPQVAAFDLILRDGFDKCESHMAFGTNNGNLYLVHHFEGKPLVRDFINNTMLGIEYLWGAPVQLETVRPVDAAFFGKAGAGVVHGASAAEHRVLGQRVRHD